MLSQVTLGRDVETKKEIRIGDMERRSGLYILGRTGTGKTTLIKKIIAQDIDNGHGVFFLDRMETPLKTCYNVSPPSAKTMSSSLTPQTSTIASASIPSPVLTRTT